MKRMVSFWHLLFLILKRFLTVLAPIPNALTNKIRKYPNMHDEEYARKRFDDSASMGPLVLPYGNEESRRVVYSITEYDPILDSSNMTIHEWVQIAKDIHVSIKIFVGRIRNCCISMECRLVHLPLAKGDRFNFFLEEVGRALGFLKQH